MRELVLLTASKAIKIVEEDPKDALGYEAAAFIVLDGGRSRCTGGDVEKTLGLVAEHHAASPKVKELLIPAMRLGEASDKLIKAVSERNTDRGYERHR